MTEGAKVAGRRLRGGGWTLVLAGVLVVSAVVVVGAWRANGGPHFDRWAVWAAVAAVPLAAVPVIMSLLDKISGGEGRREALAGDVADVLAAVVLGKAQDARSRLLGAGEAGDQAANVRFVKGMGRFREVGGARTGDLVSVREYYESLRPRRLVVLGEPGAGKTVLVMELLIALLERRRDDPGVAVPVLVSAAAYDSGRSWEEWLAGHLAQEFGLAASASARLVRDRQVLPVVDGLDEMDPAVGEPVRARALVTALNAFMAGRARAAVVVTCRRHEYEALEPGVDRAAHIQMQPLTGRESAAYLCGQFRGRDEERAWEPVLRRLRAEPDGPVAAELATPWRLTLALTVFGDGGDPSELLPRWMIPGGVATFSDRRR